MRALVVLIAALSALLLGGCGSSTAPSGSASGADEGGSSNAEVTGTGETADLGFTATTLEGEEFAGSSLEGRPAVVWFWAPWCPTCRAQIGNVTALAEKYDGQVEVVGVGALDSESAIADVAEGIPNVTHLVDEQGEVWRHFGVTAQSTYTVIDADGEIVSEGYLDDGDLNDLVAQLAG